MRDRSGAADAAPAAEARAETSALKRGLAVLELLVEATHPMTSREVADALQLSDSTAHRLLHTLWDAGYATRDEHRRFAARARSFLPLTLYHPLNVLRRDSFEQLRELREASGLSASMVVFLGLERLVLDVSGVTGSLTPYFGTCLDNPLHVAASGKLLLLGMSESARERVLGPAPYAGLTPYTLTDPAALAEDLRQAAARGFAKSLNENFVGLSAVAAPLMCGPDQMLGCLIVAGASERFSDERTNEFGTMLRARADLIACGSTAVRALRGMFPRAA